MTRNQISTFRGIRGVQHSQRRQQQNDGEMDGKLHWSCVGEIETLKFVPIIAKTR